MVQWLRFCASNAGDTGSIPGRGTKIPHAMWCAPNEVFKAPLWRGKELPVFQTSVFPQGLVWA